MNKKELLDLEARGKVKCGQTPQYKETAEKQKNRTPKQEIALGEEMMSIFTEFGKFLGTDPDSEPAKALARKLQKFITEHYYRCTDEILKSLGEMYVSDPEFTANIDSAGGNGTAEFVHETINCLVSVSRHD